MRTFFFVALLVALLIVVVVGCGGKTTTITEKFFQPDPVPTDPAIVDELAVFQPNDRGDMIELEVMANGQLVKPNDTIVLTDTADLHLISMVYGLGVVGKDARTPRANITDIELDGQGAVEVVVAITPLPKETLRPSKGAKEVMGDYDLSVLQRDTERTVQVSVAARVDPTLVVAWAAQRLGIKPMPSVGGTTIERTTVIKRSGDSWVAGVVGFALGIGLNALLPGSGVALFCPDPVVGMTFHVVIPGKSTTPPTENQPPTVSLSANPISGDVPLNVTFTATANDPDGTIAKYEWDFDGAGFMSGTATTSHSYGEVGTFVAHVRVTDNDGGTATATVTITVTKPTTPPPTTTWGGEEFDVGLVNFFTDQGEYLTLSRANEEFQLFVPYLMYDGTNIAVNTAPKKWTVSWKIVQEGTVVKSLATARVDALDFAAGVYVLRARVKFMTEPVPIEKDWNTCVITVVN